LKTPKQKPQYIVLAFPENPLLFGVARFTEGKERYLKKDPEGKETGPVYDSILHIISPFCNPNTGEVGECCSCLQWKTRKKRCTHLKKFFELNPKLKPQE
jgi:hypothetical protein